MTGPDSPGITTRSLWQNRAQTLTLYQSGHVELHLARVNDFRPVKVPISTPRKGSQLGSVSTSRILQRNFCNKPVRRQSSNRPSNSEQRIPTGEDCPTCSCVVQATKAYTLFIYFKSVIFFYLDSGCLWTAEKMHQHTLSVPGHTVLWRKRSNTTFLTALLN